MSGSGETRCRRIPAAVVIVACLLGALAICWHMFEMPIWRHVYGIFGNGIDTRVYRGGGEAVWHHRPLYDEPVYKVWQFTYTPFAALLMVPLAWLSESHAQVVFDVINVVALIAFVYLSVRALGYRRDARFWIAVLGFSVGVTILEPVRSTIWQGQINLVLAVLVLGCLTLQVGRWRGIGIGIAAGIKLTPMFFGAYLFVTRQWRAIAVAVGTFAATVVIGFLVLPRDAWRFWTAAISDTSRIGVTEWPANQSISGFLARLELLEHWHAPTWTWIPVGLVVAVLSLWAALRAHRAGAELLAITIVGLAGAAVSPMAWAHHWVWFVPLLIVSVVQAVQAWRPRRPLTWLWCLAPVLILASVFAWTQPLPRRKFAFGFYREFWDVDPRGAGEVVSLLAAGIYPIVLLVTVAVTLWWTHRRDPIRFNAAAPGEGVASI